MNEYIGGGEQEVDVFKELIHIIYESCNSNRKLEIPV